LACTLLAAASSSASVNPLSVLPKAAWVRPCGFFVVGRVLCDPSKPMLQAALLWALRLIPE
jgi:hypothetical protein